MENTFNTSGWKFGKLFQLLKTLLEAAWLIEQLFAFDEASGLSNKNLKVITLFFCLLQTFLVPVTHNVCIKGSLLMFLGNFTQQLILIHHWQSVKDLVPVLPLSLVLQWSEAFYEGYLNKIAFENLYEEFIRRGDNPFESCTSN